MTDIIVFLIILAILVPIIGYIVREKRKGHACIGCPYASNCSQNGHCTK